MARRRKTIQLFETDGTHASIQEAPNAVDSAGNHIAVQLATSGASATVELYARLTSDAPWALFETVDVDSDGFLRAYFGIPNVGAKVTVNSGGTVQGWCFYDE